MNHLKNQKGFAMVGELLIVAAVIAVISMVAYKVMDSQAALTCRNIAGRQICYGGHTPTSGGGNPGSSVQINSSQGSPGQPGQTSVSTSSTTGTTGSSSSSSTCSVNGQTVTNTGTSSSSCSVSK